MSIMNIIPDGEWAIRMIAHGERRIETDAAAKTGEATPMEHFRDGIGLINRGVVSCSSVDEAIGGER